MLKLIQNSSQQSGKATFSVVGVTFKINRVYVEVKVRFLVESHPFPAIPCLSQEVVIRVQSSHALLGLAEMYSHTHPEGKTGDGKERQKGSSEDTHLP